MVNVLRVTAWRSLVVFRQLLNSWPVGYQPGFKLELRRVTNALAADPAMRAKWRRMHVIGSVMRREPASAVDAPLPAWPADFESEAPVGSRSSKGLFAALGGAALATAAALTVVLYFGGGEPAEVAPAVAEGTQPAHGLATVPTELDVARTNAYIYQHARRTSIGARPAAMPFVKELSTAHVGPEEAADQRVP